MDMPAPVRRRRIRRVADENRKRAPRACELCKARKSKCIETISGSCQRCVKKSLVCRFNPDKSSLPEALASPTRRNSGRQDGISIMDVAASDMTEASPDGIFALSSGTCLANHSDMISDEELIANIAILDPTQQAAWPRFLSRLREAFSLDPHPVEEGERLLMQAQAARSALLQPAELQRLQKAVEACPPRPVAEFLVSVCIEHSTDVFFYFDQAQFALEMDEFYSDPASPLRRDSTFVCLAHSVLALGSQWAPRARPDSSSVSLAPEDGDPGRIFYGEASSLVPDIIERPSIRCVQALLILAVYLLPSSALGSSYMYFGLALRKALALDLHKDPDDPTLSEKDKEIRRRIWWTIYSLERCVTLKLNRMRSIDADIISVSLPTPCPAIDSLQKYDNVLHQIASARLARIMDRLGDPIHATTPPAQCAIELKEWKRSLPASFDLDSIPPKSSCYRAVFHLYLNYYYAWIAMGKVSVVTVVRAHLRHRSGTDTQPPQIETSVRELSRSCVKAAKKLLTMFEELKVTLTRFSFTDFQGCSTATIIVLLAGILDRDAGYEARVHLGLNSLRNMAEGNITAKMGVSFVESLKVIADEAAQKVCGSTNPLLADTSPQKEVQREQVSDYNSWLQWLSKANNLQYTPVSPSPQSTPGAQYSVQSQQAASWSLGNDVAGLQQLALPQMDVHPSLLPAAQDSPTQSSHLYSYTTSTPVPFDDEQAYLMGLTGIDMLNFME